MTSSLSIHGQQTDWSSEFQTEFIDISGLFGLKEPTQLTTMKYTKKNFFMGGLHAFSWKEPGKTVQTFFGTGYTFQLDSASLKTLLIKSDFAFNRVANNGSFIRPMLVAKWKLSIAQTISLAFWVFMDTRKETLQSLNGEIAYLAHILRLPLNMNQLRNEVRLTFVRINDIRDVVGITNQTRFLLSQTKVYAVANIGYSFYHSNGQPEFIWNIGIGKLF
jgi:hypothetical protein